MSEPIRYHAEILADSINPAYERVTTLQIRMPLSVWAEFLTHRSLSRNARSNRAVPVRVTLSEVYRNPFVPEVWGRNKRGMQAGEELTGWRRYAARRLWLLARYLAMAAAWGLSALGLHKQDANRILSPWQWVDAVVTGDFAAWSNFLALRHHSQADPKIFRIAELIAEQLRSSTPRQLQWNEWHLPYYVGRNVEQAWESAGACARVSYAAFDGTQSDEANRKLGMDLARNTPPHASPLEHVLLATSHESSAGPVRGQWKSLRQIQGV